MRDLLVALTIFGSIPFIFRRPYIGVLMWVWISVMNPHRLSWGFAHDFQFAAVVAVVTLLSALISREPKKIPVTAVTVILLSLVVWMNITTLFALYPQDAYNMWNRVMKILFMTFVALWILRSREHINLLVWVLVISVGYYGVKGGAWTLLGGGENRVYGPAGSFIEDNNALALALVMIIPLMRYLQMASARRLVRFSLVAVALLCAVAAMGSYSRGALLAIGAMALLLWLKSRRKIVLGSLIVLTALVMLAFMPEKWAERMDTINTFREESSAMSRINTWMTILNFIWGHLLVGGGFEMYKPEIFERYSPVPMTDVFVAHSIYFQMLAEHGLIGLLLFLLLGVAAWRTASRILRTTAAHPELKWARDLATMIQVSMAGFAVGGAFISMAYFDLPYYLLVALVLVRALVEEEVRQKSRRAQPEPAAGLRQRGGRLGLRRHAGGAE